MKFKHPRSPLIQARNGLLLALIAALMPHMGLAQSSKPLNRKNAMSTSNPPATAPTTPSSDTSPPANSASALPLFYQSVVAFDTTRHRDLSLPRQWDQFGYASRTNVIPITVTEAALALRDYPLVFVKDPKSGSVNLLALVGNGDGTNQFVDGKGKWQANAYIPAWVRRYPFLLAMDDKQQPFLAFDANATTLLKGKGERDALIDSEGKPTARLQQVMALQQEYAAAANLTEQLANKLLQAGVLEEARLTLQSPDRSSPLNLVGFMLVNEKKLRELAPAEVEKLHAADALGLAYAQIFSMVNLRKLRLPSTSKP